MKPVKRVGVLTAGGDCPGLNAAIRGVGKALLGRDVAVVGIRDGFVGLIEDRTLPLDRHALSGILTTGGTVLGTSRVKPHRMEIDGRVRDLRTRVLATCTRHRLDAVVCIGGDGTQRNALRLVESGVPVITLPKTIDNDVALTETSIGFDTALGIATDAIDRLHSTAHSHHRIIVVELMGHRAGWLTLGAGIAGGADVILIQKTPTASPRLHGPSDDGAGRG
jgi:6-phosphofructokinase 1